MQKNEQNIKSVMLRIPEEMVTLIEQYQADSFLPTRNAAIVMLIEYALRKLQYK